jgi:hypothetical protein
VAGALSVDYRRVMSSLGVEDYRANLRADIDHILIGRRAATGG